MTWRNLSTPPLRLLLVAVTLAWWWGMRAYQTGGVLAHVGLCACGVLAVVVPLACARLRPLWRCDRRALAVGAGGAALMLLATYAGYPVAVKLWPALEPAVQGLYRGLAAPTLASFLWLVPTVIAEEIVFRGLWIDAVGVDRPVRSGASAVLLFAAAQTGSGSPWVVLLALSCGAVWVVQRLWTRSLVAPLLTHALWNLAVLVLWPLAR
jgi:hypothetical protein